MKNKYNEKNRGVDKLNQHISYYKCRRKSIKYWKQIFYFWFEVTIQIRKYYIFYQIQDYQI